MVQKYITKRRGKLHVYCAFIDFSKAFDSVNRQKLFYVLHRGVHGKMSMLQKIYHSVQTCVKIGSKVINLFPCLTGVRQGCILNLWLFSMFINELVDVFHNTDGYGIHISNEIHVH